MLNGAMLDTGFLIRLLNEKDPLHEVAVGYFKYFMEEGMMMYVSTIAIAEYCVKGELSDLPLRNAMPLSFNIDHSEKAGALMRIVYAEKQKRGAAIQPRAIIPNDTKMFAQADVEKDIKYFVSADSEAKKIYNILKDSCEIHFEYIDIREYTHGQYFSLLF